MDVYRHTHDLPDSARGGVVAIGNFDGLHRGHRGVLGEAQARARKLGVPCNVMTFEPHPRRLFKPDQPPFRLSALRTKLRLMEALGIDNVFVLQFDWAFAKISAEAFVTDLLVRDLAAAHVVIGRGFRFGHKRQGDADLLARLGDGHGFGVSALDAVLDEHGQTISSSRVRECLRTGEVREAQRLLGRPWEVEGRSSTAPSAAGRSVSPPPTCRSASTWSRCTASTPCARGWTTAPTPSGWTAPATSARAHRSRGITSCWRSRCSTSRRTSTTSICACS